MTALLSTQFKNDTLNSLLRTTTNTSIFTYGALYTGSIPASGDTAATGTILHTGTTSAYQFAAGNWGSPSNGVSVLSAPKTPASITVAGTPGYFSLINSSGTSVQMFLDIGVASSGAGCILSSVSATSIGVLAPSITNLSLSWPETLGTVKLNTALRNALVNIWVNTAANIGMGNSGTIKVYSGSAPASADAAATGTLLATFATSTTTWNAASGGASALASTLSVNASASGTAGYARFANSAGTYVIQLSVGTSGADITMDSLSLTSGANTSITNATVSI